MLRLFRHIRQRLFLEGKVSRYLGYAVGEIVLIVVGILVAVQISESNQQRKDRRAETTYNNELLEDFETNKQQLEESTASFENLLVIMIELLKQSALETPSWSVDQLNEAFLEVQKMPGKSTVERAYESLIGSGDLKILKSRPLKNALAQYYSADELMKIVHNTHEMQLVQIIQPYVIENMDYQAVNTSRVDDFPLPPAVEKDRILEVLKTRKFRNIVNQKWNICNDLLNQHRMMLTRTEEIIRMLSNEAN